MSVATFRDVSLLVCFAKNGYRPHIVVLHEFQRARSAGWCRAKRERMEMRKDIRYRLDAPAVFSWQGGCRGRFHGEGITRDISVQGAFILSATLPPPDCPIQVDLMLPSLTGMSAAMRITGRARVTRVEDSAGGSWVRGFAVVTDDEHQWGLQTMQSESQFEFAGAAAAAGPAMGTVD
jgi:hypothetical protein